MLINTVILCVLALPFCDTADVVVQTQNGRLRGVRTEYSGDQYVDVYKGIPYAIPPTGASRFKAPSPATPWTGVKDASNFKSDCPQESSHNEDCLYLNVYSWKAKGKTTPLLPVMVFIHGGSFELWSGSIANGIELALHSVIIVTINYRLGVLGFLSTEDDASPGNYGMLDQVLALKWVRDNIADFGGNPHNVTIFGQSAGAASVSLHLLSPLSKGLFHGAVMESGVSITEWSFRTSTDDPSPIHQARYIGHKVGCLQTDTTLLVNCLRKVSVQSLIGVQDTVAIGRIQWSPVIENVTGFLSENPQALIDKGMLMDVPTLRGVNKDECVFYMALIKGVSHGVSLTTAKNHIHDFVQYRYRSNKRAIESAMDEVYLKNVDPSDHVAIRTRLMQFMTDAEYYIPALSETESQVKTGSSPAYMYEFDYRSAKASTPTWQGVPHSYELSFVLGEPLDGGPNRTELDKTVSKRMMGYFTNFAKTGDPSFDGVMWKPFTLNRKYYLAIGNSSVLKTDARAKEEKLWLETLPKLAIEQYPILVG